MEKENEIIRKIVVNCICGEPLSVCVDYTIDSGIYLRVLPCPKCNSRENNETALNKCPKCSCQTIEIQPSQEGVEDDIPIGRCTKCGHCFISDESKQRIKDRLGVT